MFSDLEIQTELSNMLGCKVPLHFAKIVQKALQAASEDDFIDAEEFAGYYGFMFDFSEAIQQIVPLQFRENKIKKRQIYKQIPPEFISFGKSIHDNSEVGFVLHAPEIASSDLPIAEWIPLSNNGVQYLGNHTIEAFEQLISNTLLLWRNKSQTMSSVRDRDRKTVLTLSASLNITPSTQKAEKRTEIKFEPNVPEGWRYEKTSDGVGVLAPNNTFSSLRTVYVNDIHKLDSVISAAKFALDEGFPATALWGIRETFFYVWNQSGAIQQLVPVWAKAYQQLGREILSNIVLEKLQ